jgi:hypothetical protein
LGSVSSGRYVVVSTFMSKITRLGTER